MSEKPLAMLVTAACVVPLCSLCVLGPAFVFSWLGGIFSGLDPVITTIVALVAAILAAGLFDHRRRRRRRELQAQPPCRLEASHD
jgi:hypothetical protein